MQRSRTWARRVQRPSVIGRPHSFGSKPFSGGTLSVLRAGLPGVPPTSGGSARSSGPPRPSRACAKHTSARSPTPPHGWRVWNQHAETRGRPGGSPQSSTRSRLSVGAMHGRGDHRGRTRRPHAVRAPRQLMHSLVFTPSASSTGERRPQGGLPKTGHSHARRALGAGAWASRSPAQGHRQLQRRRETVPTPRQESHWQA
jgi:hypothetical protein